MAAAAVVGIISALVGAGTAIGTGVAKKRDLRQAQAEARGMYEREEEEDRKERRQQMLEKQEKLGLEKEKVNKQWLEYIDNKKKYREQINQAKINIAGNTMQRTMAGNMALRDKIMSYYQ